MKNEKNPYLGKLVSTKSKKKNNAIEVIKKPKEKGPQISAKNIENVRLSLLPTKYVF